MSCKPRTRTSPSSAQQSLLLCLASHTELQVAPFTVPGKVLGAEFVVPGYLQCRTYDHGSLSAAHVAYSSSEPMHMQICLLADDVLGVLSRNLNANDFTS